MLPAAILFSVVKRPSMKWKFESFFNLDVKVVLGQPLVRMGQLPDWLCNLAHGLTMMVLDTFNNNLCLWRCIVVSRRARTGRSTAAARVLAQSYHGALTNDFPGTSLNELDNVEWHLIVGKPVDKQLGIRVYELERGEGGDIVWHLCQNPLNQAQNVLAIGVFEGHAFLIKYIEKLCSCKPRTSTSSTSLTTSVWAQSGHQL